MVNNTKKEEGITLIALVTTIVVLLILASITIGALSGEGGLIGNANEAKEKTEIANEKEVVDRAVVQAMGKNKRGNLVRIELQDELDKITGEGETEVTIDEVDYGYFVKFLDSGRIYKVSRDGDVEYLGKEEELLTQANIIANPESNTTPEFIQTVELTVETPIDIGDVDFLLVSAWSQDKNTAPEDSEFQVAQLAGEGRRRTTTVKSSASVGGDYYLWVRVVVGEIEKEECFGPYAIKDSTTLVATASEDTSESNFLGMPIERGLIQSVEIKNTLVGTGHSLGDGNTYDVTDGSKGKYLGWYEQNENGYYDVTIAGEGEIVANRNSSYLFANIGYGITDEEVTITGLEYLDTGLVNNMRSIFYNCKATELDVTNFNTENVTNMRSMFNRIVAKNLDLSKLNTSNVIDMQYMFFQCQATTINLSNLDTSKVTNMSYMFSQCQATTINLSNLDTSKVTNMSYMFSQCQATTINLSNLDTSKVTNMSYMFFQCQATTIDLSNLDMNKVTNISYMFSQCQATTIDLSNLDMNKVTDMSNMFNGCSSLKNLDLSGFDTSNVTNMSQMFNGCNNLTNLDLSSFNTEKITSMELMFNGCSSLTNLDLSSFDTSNVTNMNNMFQGCSSLSNLDVSSFNTSNVTNMSGMFRNCRSLEQLDLSSFYTFKVTSMNEMFNRSNKILYLDIRNFDITNLTDYANMFGELPSNIEIIVNSATRDWILNNFTFIKENNITTVD